MIVVPGSNALVLNQEPIYLFSSFLGGSAFDLPYKAIRGPDDAIYITGFTSSEKTA